MRDACDAVGMTIEGFRMDSAYIGMKPCPERDRKIDQILENVRKTHLVGVGLISQHWTMIPIRRNGKEPGRGGSTYETFKLEENWKELPAGIAGDVSSEEYWERITHSHPGGPGKLQAYAFGYGYIHALINGVNSEAL
jgi:hypothetical protein